MLEELKEQVFRANLMLPEHGLVSFTWGNVSGIERGQGLMTTRPLEESRALTLPPVQTTRLYLGSSIWSRHSSSLS